MDKKVLVLGGAGFIGLNIIKRLVAKGYKDITLADNFARGKQDNYFDEIVKEGNIKVVEGDFTDPKAFDQFDDNYDHFYMMASVVGVDNANSIPHEIIRINTMLIINSLEWVKRSKIGKVLFTSTSECYAGAVESFDYKVPTDEEVPLTIKEIGHPRFTYAVTKMLGESGFLNYSKILGFDACIIRYHNVYGPRMGFKHVIPHLAVRFKDNEQPFKVYGHDQTRAFSYIDDAAEATVLAMESEKTNGEILHLGTDVEITIEELIKYCGEVMEYDGIYENAPTYPGSVSRRCPDISKSKSLLNYTPQTSWQDGVKETMLWYKNYLLEGKEVFE